MPAGLSPSEIVINQRLPENKPADPPLDYSTLTIGEVVTMWLEQRTVATGWTQTAIIYLDYERFCHSIEVNPLPVRMFGYALTLANVGRQRIEAGSLRNITLISAQLPANIPRRPPPKPDQKAEPPQPTLANSLRRRGLLR